MNGALLVTLAWILDVFLGPAFGGGTSAIARVFPLHFPQLLLTSQATDHGGPVGDLGWSLLWAVGLGGLAVPRLLAAIRPAPRPTGLTHPDPAIVPAPATAASTHPPPRPAPIARRPLAPPPPPADT